MSFWRSLSIVALLAALLGIGTSTALAGGYHHGRHHGYYGHSSFRLGLGWAHPPPYERPYPPSYGYFPGYTSAWGPGFVNIGYGYGGHRSSYGLSRIGRIKQMLRISSERRERIPAGQAVL